MNQAAQPTPTTPIDSPESLFCPFCKATIYADYFYCPQCGKQVRKKALSVGIWQQISIYLVSILFPPFGLIPALRYLTSFGTKAKIIGGIALILSILSIMLVTYGMMQLFAMIASFLGDASTITELSSYESY